MNNAANKTYSATAVWTKGEESMTVWYEGGMAHIENDYGHVSVQSWSEWQGTADWLATDGWTEHS